MQLGAFLGCPPDVAAARPLKADRPVHAFLDWLDSAGVRNEHGDEIARLVRRSVLEGDRALMEDARQAMAELERAFVDEWDGLRALAQDEGVKDSGKSRMAIELRRLCGEFLLSGLADRGFLPGHGFPTDVVTFIPGKEFKSGEQVTPDGTRQFRALGPQRSLDLAIRDYAPGSEVVLDGLVHKSAGVTLNWKRPASEENVADIQSLRYFWRCQTCQAASTRRASRPPYCTVCGSSDLEFSEFLSPSGFSVDPREKVHAETDSIAYVPPEDPQVSVRGANWQSLAAPEAGRFRCSREGLVYYSNKGGPHGFGYALCLQCGRAEPDTDNRGLTSPQPALVDHKPLRYRKGVDFCPGNDKPFSIRRNISLGHEITTDVFELQPRHRLKRAGANALAIALREGLAQELGVEADEMGFAVSDGTNALGAPAFSIFLFDRAAGGAGFSVALEHVLRRVLKRAEDVLNCNTPGCQKACASCVLTTDAPEGKDELDRIAALHFLREHLSLPDELSAEDRIANSAVLSVSPFDEIDRYLRNSARSELLVFVPSDTDPAAISEWPVISNLLHWTMRGHPVRIGLDPNLLTRLTAAEKLTIRDLGLRTGASVCQAEAPRFRQRRNGFGCRSVGSR